MADNRISDFSMFPGGGWSVEVSTSSAMALPGVAPPAGTADLYSAAWSIAQRDVELDRLFNAAFYYEI